jgi:hypothetical protein
VIPHALNQTRCRNICKIQHLPLVRPEPSLNLSDLAFARLQPTTACCLTATATAAAAAAAVSYGTAAAAAAGCW